jgi:hypothetical protein
MGIASPTTPGGNVMSQMQVEVQGTLQADGTLVLDEKPNLSPGRVRVVVQAAPEKVTPTEPLMEFLQRSRQELKAAGSHFLNEQELNAHIEWLREGDAIDVLLRQAEEEPQQQERP